MNKTLIEMLRTIFAAVEAGEYNIEALTFSNAEGVQIALSKAVTAAPLFHGGKQTRHAYDV